MSEHQRNDLKREFYYGDTADEAFQYGLKHEKYTAACIMFMILKAEYSISPERTRYPRFREEPYADYKPVMLKHLFLTMVKEFRSEGEEVPLSSYLEHPYFKDIPDLLAFENRVWGFVSSRGKDGGSPDEMLNKYSDVVFTGNWLDSIISPELHYRIIRSRKWEPGTSPWRFTQLWNAKRNRDVHSDEDSLALKDEIGAPPIQSFMYWERRFPYFSMYIFYQMLQYVDVGYRGKRTKFHDLPELRFFFPGTPRFYDLCSQVPLIEK